MFLITFRVNTDAINLESDAVDDKSDEKCPAIIFHAL